MRWVVLTNQQTKFSNGTLERTDRKFCQVSCTRPDSLYNGTMASETDTIPRLHHLVPHLGDQLAGLDDKPTFEDCRHRYIATAERLEREGKGRRTASRVGD